MLELNLLTQRDDFKESSALEFRNLNEWKNKEILFKIKFDHPLE